MTYFLYTLPNTLKGSTGSFSSGGVEHRARARRAASVTLSATAATAAEKRRRPETLSPRTCGPPRIARGGSQCRPKGGAVDVSIHDAIASRSPREGGRHGFTPIELTGFAGRVAEPKLFILRVRRNSRSPNARAFGKRREPRRGEARSHVPWRLCRRRTGMRGTRHPGVSARFLNANRARSDEKKPRSSQVCAEVTALATAVTCLGPRAGLARHGRERISGSRGGVQSTLSDEDPRSNQYIPACRCARAPRRHRQVLPRHGSLPVATRGDGDGHHIRRGRAVRRRFRRWSTPGTRCSASSRSFRGTSRARIFGATPRTVRLRADGDREERGEDAQPAISVGPERLCAARLIRRQRGKTKAFIHCNPHNPTGVMFSEARRGISRGSAPSSTSSSWRTRFTSGARSTKSIPPPPLRRRNRNRNRKAA